MRLKNARAGRRRPRSSKRRTRDGQIRLRSVGVASGRWRPSFGAGAEREEEAVFRAHARRAAAAAVFDDEALATEGPIQPYSSEPWFTFWSCELS